MVHRKNRMREIRQSWGRADPGRTRMAPSDIAFLLAEVDRLEHLSPQLSEVDPAELARVFHDTYESLAPVYDYKIRTTSAVPWEDVLENNRKLLIATIEVVLGHLAKQ